MYRHTQSLENVALHATSDDGQVLVVVKTPTRGQLSLLKRSASGQYVEDIDISFPDIRIMELSLNKSGTLLVFSYWRTDQLDTDRVNHVIVYDLQKRRVIRELEQDPDHYGHYDREYGYPIHISDDDRCITVGSSDRVCSYRERAFYATGAIYSYRSDDWLDGDIDVQIITPDYLEHSLCFGSEYDVTPDASRMVVVTSPRIEDASVEGEALLFTFDWAPELNEWRMIDREILPLDPTVLSVQFIDRDQIAVIRRTLGVEPGLHSRANFYHWILDEWHNTQTLYLPSDVRFNRVMLSSDRSKLVAIEDRSDPTYMEDYPNIRLYERQEDQYVPDEYIQRSVMRQRPPAFVDCGFWSTSVQNVSMVDHNRTLMIGMWNMAVSDIGDRINVTDMTTVSTLHIFQKDRE